MVVKSEHFLSFLAGGIYCDTRALYLCTFTVKAEKQYSGSN